jgi:hypothetical protein
MMDRSPPTICGSAFACADIEPRSLRVRRREHSVMALGERGEL